MIFVAENKRELNCFPRSQTTSLELFGVNNCFFWIIKSRNYLNQWTSTLKVIKRNDRKDYRSIYRAIRKKILLPWPFSNHLRLIATPKTSIHDLQSSHCHFLYPGDWSEHWRVPHVLIMKYLVAAMKVASIQTLIRSLLLPPRVR